MNFKQWLENIDFAQELDPRAKSLFWKKDRRWKNLLKTEPYIQLANIVQLLQSNTDRIHLLKNYAGGVVLAMLFVDLFPEVTQNYSVLKNLKKYVADSLPHVTNEIEALETMEKIYNLNSPVRVGYSFIWNLDMIRQQFNN